MTVTQRTKKLYLTVYFRIHLNTTSNRQINFAEYKYLNWHEPVFPLNDHDGRRAFAALFIHIHHIFTQSVTTNINIVPFTVHGSIIAIVSIYFFQKLTLCWCVVSNSNNRCWCLQVLIRVSNCVHPKRQQSHPRLSLNRTLSIIHLHCGKLPSSFDPGTKADLKVYALQ